LYYNYQQLSNINLGGVIMEFIKEVEISSRTCVIRTNYYGSSLQKFLDFFSEAKKDFPSLTPEQVEIKHYGGDRIKHIFGLEFQVPSEVTISESYKRIPRLEFTL
jgi:hypothetical protein